MGMEFSTCIKFCKKVELHAYTCAMFAATIEMHNNKHNMYTWYILLYLQKPSSPVVTTTLAPLSYCLQKGSNNNLRPLITTCKMWRWLYKNEGTAMLEAPIACTKILYCWTHISLRAWCLGHWRMLSVKENPIPCFTETNNMCLAHIKAPQNEVIIAQYTKYVICEALPWLGNDVVAYCNAHSMECN